MRWRKSLGLATALLISSSALVALPPAEQAAAATGGCGDRAHGGHTKDRRPFNAWACWIDKGDDIRVCDNSPRNNYHAHAELWLKLAGGGKIGTEDDGPDRGCDTVHIKDGDLPDGVYDLSLFICEQHNRTQAKRNCKEIQWIEVEG